MSKQGGPRMMTKERQSNRRERGAPFVAVLLFLLVAAFAGPAHAGRSPAEPPLLLEAIEIEGNTRTPVETVNRYLPLRAGQEVTPISILLAVEELERSGIFERVEYASRPGGERGAIVLLLTVTEWGVDFRFGAGYQDLSGWYLIPAELRFDNRLGRGERTRLHARLGHRLAGVAFLFEEPRFGDGRNHWGFSLSGFGNNRIYYVDGIEYRHALSRASFEAHAGRRLTEHLEIELGGCVESVEVDSFAEAYSESEALGVDIGDRLEVGDLPAGVAADVGKESRGILRLDWTWDSRGPRLVAGSPASGLWGRVRTEEIIQGDHGFPRVTADLRTYGAFASTALAARLRAGFAGESAPFHDRFYVGGLYTVRGFPSQSLSDPSGETKFWSASVEVRRALIGSKENPRLAGLLFLEAGDGWNDESPRWSDIAAGAGYGFRLRVPWVGWLGVDVGIPLTDTPAEESFHGHASIGWTF